MRQNLVVSMKSQHFKNLTLRLLVVVKKHVFPNIDFLSFFFSLYVYAHSIYRKYSSNASKYCHSGMSETGIWHFLI